MPATPALTLGTTTTATLTVTPTDLASSFTLSPHDQYPAVLSTGRLIALMEIAASRALTPLLSPTQLSVGVGVDQMVHSAATPVGEVVVATAIYRGREGKGGRLYAWDVEARDRGGVVGRMRHTRAVVEREGIERGAEVRVKRDKGKL